MLKAPILHEAFHPKRCDQRAGSALSGLGVRFGEAGVAHDDRVSRRAQDALAVVALGLVTFINDRCIGVEVRVTCSHRYVLGPHAQTLSRTLPNIEVRSSSTTS
jgi:hypothetical protein